MLDRLKACKSLGDLATLLGMAPKELSFVLYMIPDANKYTTFQIAKKNGAYRTINSPKPKLKFVQDRLSKVLYDCIDEIIAENPKAYSSSIGFGRHKSIVDNAAVHRGRRHVFNIDIEDFYGSIHIGRVRAFFVKDRSFMLADRVALVIAQISCHGGVLPQGAPCSPVISNLIGSLLDSRLRAFSARERCTYTRYVDDLTFSTNLLEFPPHMAISSTDDQRWTVAPQLESRIASAGFLLNQSKTRLSTRGSRQMVTGLVTNNYPNVPCEYSHVTRAMCHSVFSNKIPHIVRFYDKEMVKEPVGIAVIEGRLSFEYYVKCIKQKRIVKDMQDHPSSFEQTFRDFLLFKTFFKAKRPLIIAEGKSDRIYLRAAARTIFATDTIFYDAGTKAFNFDVFQFPQRVHDLTGLASGTGNLTRGLVKLRDFTRRYPNLNPSQPVIFLIDFDEGSKSFVEQAKKLFNAKISSTNTEDFVRLMPGIFLVRTPSVKGSEPSFIESFLPSKVLTTEIEGKMFSSAAKIDPERNFGKVRMAQHVSLNSDHIKMDGFMPLLERIRTAIISV